MNVTLIAVVALLAGLGVAAYLIRRAGKKAAEGEQAKAALEVERRVKDVPQPLPGETEKSLRDGEF